MSDGRTVGLSDRKTAAPKANVPHNKPTDRPTVRPSDALPSISHPPDLATRVVAHQQRPVRQHEETHGPSPPLAVGTLPAHDEILHSNCAMPATWAPVGTLRFHEPCSVTKASPRYSRGNCEPV